MDTNTILQGMRTNLSAFIILITISTACKKEDDAGNNPVRNEIGYLLSKVIIDKDTTRFQYDNNNRVTGITHISNSTNYVGTWESIQYNPNGTLKSFRYTYKGNVTVSQLDHLSYQNDTIIKTAVPINADYGDAIKFIFSNDHIVETREGGVLNGIILQSGFWDTTHYMYQEGNLVNRVSRFLTPAYQAKDTFSYHPTLYNPYLLLGKHNWSLLAASLPALLFGESKNIPQLLTRATYAVSGTTLLSSGFSYEKVVATENAHENSKLPKMVKTLTDNGSEVITQYFYQKQK